MALIRNIVIARIGTPKSWDDISTVTLGEVQDIISPMEGLDEVVIIDPSEPLNMETLAVECGIFPSKNKARKNGFGGPIPFGLEAWGTKKKWFWVWNLVEPESTPTIKKNFNQTARRIG